MAGEARDLQREPYTAEELAVIWVAGGPPKLTEPIAVRRQWTYVQQYADAKTGVIEEILRRAGGGGQ